MIYPNQKKNIRKKILLYIYILILILVCARYYKLQIIDYEKYKLLGVRNSINLRVLNAPRGIIYDRKTRPIVDNKFIYDINIIPIHFNKDKFNYEIMKNVAGINRIYIDSVISSSDSKTSDKPQLIKRHIDFKTKSILEENKLDLQGMYFSEFPIRTYTTQCNMTHILGYLRQHNNNEIISYSGLEKIYDESLKGNNGVEYHLVDSRGIDKGVINFENKNFNPIQGDDLSLTIDIKLQSFCENLIDGYKGTIIVSDPETGEIYSMHSFPDYSLNSFIGPISKNQWSQLNDSKNNVFLNRAIQSAYPPGSIFKLILSAIALEKNLISEDWKVNCTGEYDFFNTKFHCWNESGHGIINLNQAIHQSCNIYFYNLMQKTDFTLWSNQVEQFGFGKQTNIDLTSERSGLVPTKKYMDKLYKNKGGWSKGHLLNLSIGQGETLVTPIQISNLINYICNEGYSYQPHINKNINVIKKTIDYNKDVWKIIKKAMKDAVYKNGGTAYNAKIPKSKGVVYGKTGTVQVCSNCDISPHAWFAGFIETKNNKKFTVTILIENGGKGSNIPTKAAKKIFEYLVDNDI